MHRDRARWAVVAAVVVLASLAATGIAVGQDRVTMTVTVVDDEGNALSDVDVSATWDGGGPVNETTKANGQALMDVRAGANVTVRITDDAYVRNSPYVHENASQESITVPAARAGSATISVDDDGGDPVSGAIVRLQHDGDFVVNARTNTDGRLRTGDIEQGDYEQTVYKAGYLRNESTLTVDGDVSETVTIAEASRSMTVEVTDDHYDDPRPVRNATVEIGQFDSISTLANGVNSIRVPVNDEYRVRVTKPGYRSTSRTVEVREEDVVLNTSIRRQPSLSVSADRDRVLVGETVQVSVTDEYGDPVPDAEVSIDGEQAATTDEGGQAVLTIESVGEREVTVEDGSLSASTTIEGVQAAPDETPTGTPGEGGTPTPVSPLGGPGFTTVTALAAVLLGALLLARRQ